MNFSGYIDCAHPRSQPPDTFSVPLPPLTPVSRRRGSYAARAQCQRKREDSSEGRGCRKDMRQHAAGDARNAAVECGSAPESV